MKKMASAFLIFALVTAFAFPVVLQANPSIAVTIDGTQVQFDVSPQIIDGRTMVPMRAIFEALGATVEWEGAVQMVTAITAKGDVIQLAIGSNAIILNGSLTAMDTVPMLIDGRTMVPARFVAEAMGMHVNWDEGVDEVVITSPRIRTITAGTNESFAVTDSGVLWRWQGFIGDITPSRKMDNVIDVSVNQGHTMVIRDDGSLWAWGCNQFGKLGDGTDIWQHTPVRVIDDGVITGSAGRSHTMAVRADGSLWAWGSNHDGQLGDGTTVDRFNPVRIMGDVAAVSAGGSHTLAIRSDGSLWAWGSNRFGELGYGDYGSVGTSPDGMESIPVKQLTPVRVMSGVVAVAAGEVYSMALTYDGGLWFWGMDSFISPEYGWITFDVIPEPRRIMDDVAAISGGWQHKTALRTDGSLWVWGINEHGSFGDGTNVSRRIPVRVIDDVVTVSAEGWNTMAVRTDGSVWGWGRRFGERPVEIMGTTMKP